MRRFSRRLCPLAVSFGALLAPAASSAHRPVYLSMASAKRAVATYERGYWGGEDISMRILGCDRRSAVQVICTAEGESADGSTRVSTTDSVTLLPQDVIRVHPGRVEEVLVLGG